MLSMFSWAPIRAQTAIAAARELFGSGWRTAQRMAESTWQQRVDALGRGGYKRYDESTAKALGDNASLIIERYGGDLRKLRAAAHGDPRRVRELLRGLERVGPVGAEFFCREAQGIWPEPRGRLIWLWG